VYRWAWKAITLYRSWGSPLVGALNHTKGRGRRERRRRGFPKPVNPSCDRNALGDGWVTARKRLRKTRDRCGKRAKKKETMESASPGGLNRGNERRFHERRRMIGIRVLLGVLGDVPVRHPQAHDAKRHQCPRNSDSGEYVLMGSGPAPIDFTTEDLL
jgi:hypothetical protein